MTDGGEGGTPGNAPPVRPYVITGGRAAPGGPPLRPDALVLSAGIAPPTALPPEHGLVLAHCRAPRPAGEVAARLGLPSWVVRVLLADLIAWGLVVVRPTGTGAGVEDADVAILRKVLNGLETRL
ncbi:DUF742 domain-containing protein [Streptomyces sp. NPDC057638]|uniref:DUF742 domain-containing protein n=1 Tax=Streptomyces sp. NPDC057638 TaxID=3346190 RepID=UPI0036A13368